MSSSLWSKHRLLSLVIVLLLAACGSSPTQVQNQVAEAEIDSQEVVHQPDKNSQYFIQKAKNVDPETSRGMYIQALKYALTESRSPAYLVAIVEQIDIDSYNSVGLDIELAKGLLAVAEFEPNLNDEAEIVMSRLNQGNVHRKHKLALWLLKAQLESNRQQHMLTVQTYHRIYELHGQYLTDPDKQRLEQILWKHLLQLSPQALQQFQNDFGATATGWISLASIIKENLTNATTLPNQLNSWQRRFPQHANSPFLPSPIQKLLSIEPYQPQRITLLLPMSGKLQRQAESIRNGFLTAMGVNQDTVIDIIDTYTNTLADIENTILANQSDFIVGPLLKENVEMVMTSEVLKTIPTLYLNTPDNLVTETPYQNAYYFALAPEDEIEQAVDYFIDNNIKHPTLIYADNSLGRRLAQYFNQLWLKASGSEVESIAFKNKSKLGEAVEELLDVNLSNARIAEMKQLFGSALETAARSRTDIDAVYIIANSQQTRLIKPFFDVNVSIFGEKLPIFGSSRSYLVDESRSQKRDLNDLTFTEMPWLIRNKARDLHTLYEDIGEQQTQLKKLFAFGYDAQQLIFALKQLDTLRDQSFDGLTGRLAIGENKRIKRDLEWSRYQQGRIIAVAQVAQ